MKNVVFAVMLICAGACGGRQVRSPTPYPVGNGRYVISSKVTGEVPLSEATARVHAAAREVCRGDYTLADQKFAPIGGWRFLGRRRPGELVVTAVCAQVGTSQALAQ